MVVRRSRIWQCCGIRQNCSGRWPRTPLLGGFCLVWMVMRSIGCGRLVPGRGSWRRRRQARPEAACRTWSWPGGRFLVLDLDASIVICHSTRRTRPSPGRRRSATTGAKGHRWYDWALIDTVDVAADPAGTGRHWLLIRRHRRTGEPAFYRAQASASVPLAELVRVAGTRWKIGAPPVGVEHMGGQVHHAARAGGHRHVIGVVEHPTGAAGHAADDHAPPRPASVDADAGHDPPEPIVGPSRHHSRGRSGRPPRPARPRR